MAKLAFVTVYEGREIRRFWCPGCRSIHDISVNSGAWTWDGDEDKPSVMPSIRVDGKLPLNDDEYEAVLRGERVVTHPFVCHSFITDGRIKFENDSTHSIAGQTVDLEDVDEKYLT